MLGRPTSCISYLGQSEVSLREVLTREQQRFIGQPGNRVGQAVTEIESGLVTAPTEPQERINSLSPVAIAERDLLDTDLFNAILVLHHY